MPPLRNRAVSLHRNELQRLAEIAARKESIRRLQQGRSEKSAGRFQGALQDHDPVRPGGSGSGELVRFHAHTSRLPPPHSLREKHAADHARHEIRRRGETAPRAPTPRKFSAFCAPPPRAWNLPRILCCSGAPKRKSW